MVECFEVFGAEPIELVHRGENDALGITGKLCVLKIDPIIVFVLLELTFLLTALNIVECCFVASFADDQQLSVRTQTQIGKRLVIIPAFE